MEDDASADEDVPHQPGNAHHMPSGGDEPSYAKDYAHVQDVKTLFDEIDACLRSLVFAVQHPPSSFIALTPFVASTFLDFVIEADDFEVTINELAEEASQALLVHAVWPEEDGLDIIMGINIWQYTRLDHGRRSAVTGMTTPIASPHVPQRVRVRRCDNTLAPQFLPRETLFDLQVLCWWLSASLRFNTQDLTAIKEMFLNAQLIPRVPRKSTNSLL